MQEAFELLQSVAEQLGDELAAQGAAALLGPWVAVSVSETMQGGRDLDGDGAVDGNVVHVFGLEEGVLVDLGLDTFSLLASGPRLFMAPAEDLAATDWNQDGDWNDVDEQSDESFPASDPPANY